MQGQRTWFITSLSSAVASVLLAGLVIFVPDPYAAALLFFGVLVFLVVLWHNPAYRYWRMAVCTISGWIVARTLPNVGIDVEFQQNIFVRFLLSQELGWSFDLAAALIALALIVADVVSTRSVSGTRILVSVMRAMLRNRTQARSIANSQQVRFGNVVGDHNTINISHGGSYQEIIPQKPSHMAISAINAERQFQANPIPERQSGALSAARIRERFQFASGALLAWPTELGIGEWIPRPELRLIDEQIGKYETTTILLLGQPGCGKSALLARIGCELREQNVALLAIKADTLPEDITDIDKLSAYLHLEAPVDECIRQLATSERVVILIDQLDAIAALVDLRPGRLNALLNLVRKIGETSNVHVVVSCREFEHRHDARLTAIDADVVQLSLPSWDQIGEVLRNRGVPTDGWPPSFHELLRIPQHLKVFLQRFTNPSEQQVFASYQGMLDDLWVKRVTDSQGPPGRSDLVMDIATAMAQRESLWVPVVLFEGRESLINSLIASEILRNAPDGSGIGFAHQTLFEHAWARAFAREKCSLADYTLARQDGLFIRSTVWAGLSYLSGADPTNYRREFGILWNRMDLRLHLRHLLVEFLGGVKEPDVQERAWLFGALRDQTLEGRVLSAVRGNSSWFSALSESHLPRLMREGTANSALLAGVITAAWSFARAKCLELIGENWRPDPAKDELSWHALMHLSAWDPAAVELACMIANRTRINRAALVHLAAQVVASAPALAPQIVAVGLQRELEELEREPDPSPPSNPGDFAETERIAQILTYKAKERFNRLIQDTNGWYAVQELAEKAPQEFLAAMWPLVVRAVEHVLSGATSSISRFRQDYCLALEFREEDDEHRNHPLLSSIDLAIRLVALNAPEKFIEFLHQERTIDSETIQRLLARGLVEIAQTQADLGLRFLIDDARRFELGPHTDDHADTILLMQSIAPFLSNAQVSELESAIRNWSRIKINAARHNVEARFEGHRYNRRRRLRLLAALPVDRLSAAARALIDREQRVFPDHGEAGVSQMEGGFIGSPMSAEQMGRATNENIVNLFRGLPDSTEDSHPRNWLRGGSRQASSEFEKFATASPDRAAAILDAFQSGQNERPAGAGLVGLSKSSADDEALFRMSFELDARGFQSEEFRIDAARAIEARLKTHVGLPDEVCDLLERWLADSWTQREPPQRIPVESENTPTSVLWQRGGMHPIPYGTYHLLHALTYGYLLRKPPAADKWLAALQAHCERPEQTETWLSLARDLKHLHLCDHGHASRFLARLFERFPGVLEREEGAVLLSNVWSFVPADSMWTWLGRIRLGLWPNGAQAYGELLALRALVYPEDAQAQRELSSVLDSVWDGSDEAAAVATGVAFTCANMWQRPKSRQAATGCLVRLISKANKEISNAVMHVFAASDSLLPDEATHRLLDALLSNPGVLACGDNGWFIEHLERLLPNEAETVYRLCREVVHLHGEDLASYQKSWAMHAANLTNVALTLHRLVKPYREMGLELFEGLLAARLPDAESALHEIDQRVPGDRITVAPRARQRRRPRGTAES